MRQLRGVQRSLPRHAVVSLITSPVLTKLDYCNSLLVGLPAKLLNHSRQSSTQQLVCLSCYEGRSHYTCVERPTLAMNPGKDPVQAMCPCVSSVMIRLLAPPYLSDQLQQVARMEPRQRLRSSSSPTLVVPPTRRSSLGDRAFLVAAARP